MANLIAQQVYRTKRWEFPAEIRICGVGVFRKNKPNAVVSGKLDVVSQHTNDSIAKVDRETGEHPANLWIQGHKRVQHKCVRGALVSVSRRAA